MAWEDLGLPSGLHFRALLYCPACEALIAHMYQASGNRHGSLWVRRRADKSYQRLTPDDPLREFRDPIVCPTLPYVFVNAWRVRNITDIHGKEVLGWDWEALEIYDLEARCRYSSISNLQGGTSTTQAWISDLVGPSGRETSLLCKVALQQSQGNVDYWLAELDWRTGAYECISLLEGTFL